jgi:membrane-associated protease RseP (regulator of RpoE activity)
VTLGIVLFVIAILLVVMIHEAGHLLTAKLFGFKATQFFVGFGPTLLSTKRGETEYGVKAIPAGGFVKIVGMNPYEEVAPEDRERSYQSKPRWQRAIVLAAGSGTHFIVAFLILMVTSMTLGFPTGGVTTNVATVQTSIAGKSTPAADAELRPGDEIVAIGDLTNPSWGELRRYIRTHPGETTTLTVKRGSDTLTLEAPLARAAVDDRGRTLAYAPANQPLERPSGTAQIVGFLGVSPEPRYRTKGFWAAAGDAGSRTWTLTKLSVTGIGQVFGQVFDGQLWQALSGTGQRAPDEGPLGLVGAGRIAGQSVATGQYLNLIGLIVGFTVFVGLMNLLPLPPLDGGHLAALAVEAVSGKPVDMRKLIPIAAAVISFFVLLFVAVLYLDLARPVKLPF